MIRSMTGYGKVSKETDRFDIDIEIKSVNHRYTDFNFRTPPYWQSLEIQLRNVLKEKISRGAVTLSVNLNKKGVSENLQTINEDVAKFYCDHLENLATKLKIDAPVDWNALFKFNGLFDQSQTKFNEEEYYPQVEEMVRSVVDKLVEFREKEGAVLEQDLLQNLDLLEKWLLEIETQAAGAVVVQLEKLKERLKKYFDGVSVEKERLEQEMVLMADRVDISEETSRFHSHVQLFRETLLLNEPVGQKMNFLTQEMHREVNTMSSKTNLTAISHLSVKMKETIERIREQVQNIE